MALTVGGSWPDEFVTFDNGTSVERCSLTLNSPPPQLQGVSGWMPAGKAVCKGWQASITFLALHPDDIELSIAVLEGNVFYQVCPSKSVMNSRIGSLNWAAT